MELKKVDSWTDRLGQSCPCQRSVFPVLTPPWILVEKRIVSIQLNHGTRPRTSKRSSPCRSNSLRFGARSKPPSLRRPQRQREIRREGTAKTVSGPVPTGWGRMDWVPTPSGSRESGSTTRNTRELWNRILSSSRRKHIGIGWMIWKRMISWISSRMAFYPPEPPGYDVQEDTMGNLHYTDNFEEQVSKLHPLITHRIKRVFKKEGRGIRKKSKNIIVSYFFHRKATKTILFSHGNATDLGRIRFSLLRMAWTLRVNVVGYDYSGYGRSSGRPSVLETLADIVACWEDVTKVEGIDPMSIVLYGQSVGTGPTLFLASRLEKELSSCVLESPFLSGMRALHPGLKRWPAWADVYPNEKYIQKVDVPVLILHGKRDNTIPIDQGYALFKLCKFPLKPLWMDATHDNIESTPEFLPRLKSLLHELDEGSRAM